MNRSGRARPDGGRACLLVAGAAVGAVVLVILMTGQGDIIARVAAVSGAALVLFSTRIVPEPVTAFSVILAFMAMGAAPAEIIFSGFSSGGFWLLLSGLIIGTAITTTGLGRQIALRIAARTDASHLRATLLLAACGFGLGLLVPSTIPRIIVLMPIALSLSEAMGHAPGSRGHIGLTMTAATTTLLPTYAFLTANLPTILQFGAIETLYGIKPSYADYFVQQAPINLVRLLVLLAVLLPYAPRRSGAGLAMQQPASFTAAQQRLMCLLAVAIGFWATDSWHGIAPAWVALTAATILLVPAAGMMDRDAMRVSIDLSPVFFLAGIFSISAVASHSGLSALVADMLVPHLGLGQAGHLRDLYALTGFSVLISHLVTAPAATVLLASLAEPMSHAVGWSITTVSMAQVIGLATPILPHQAPPLIIAIGLAQIPVMALVRVCAIVALVTAAVGMPLTYLWWQALGLF